MIKWAIQCEVHTVPGVNCQTFKRKYPKSTRGCVLQHCVELSYTQKTKMQLEEIMLILLKLAQNVWRRIQLKLVIK